MEEEQKGTASFERIVRDWPAGNGQYPITLLPLSHFLLPTHNLHKVAAGFDDHRNLFC
jgi:hypothetical protein